MHLVTSSHLKRLYRKPRPLVALPAHALRRQVRHTTSRRLGSCQISLEPALEAIALLSANWTQQIEQQGGVVQDVTRPESSSG